MNFGAILVTRQIMAPYKLQCYYHLHHHFIITVAPLRYYYGYY